MSHTPPPGVPVYDPSAPLPERLASRVHGAARPYPELTNRELEVAYALANGDTNREIAARLEISIKTVDTHRGHLLKKLGCRNNVALTRLMIRDGLVTV